MQDPLDVQIDDPELGQEIQLLSDLMVVAARSDALDEETVDAVLLDGPVPQQRERGLDQTAE